MIHGVVRAVAAALVLFVAAGLAVAQKGGSKAGHAAAPKTSHGAKPADKHKHAPAPKHKAAHATAKHVHTTKTVTTTTAPAGHTGKWQVTYRDQPGAPEAVRYFGTQAAAESWLQGHRKSHPQAEGAITQVASAAAPAKK
jgi:hypothetical protein